MDEKGLVQERDGESDRKLRVFVQQLVHAGGIEADDHFFVDNNGGRGVAAVGAHQFEDRFCIPTDVALLVYDASRREVGLNKLAGGSTGLGKKQDAGHGGV